MSDTHINDIVETLLLPFENDLRWSTSAAFLRAREAPALHGHDLSSIVYEQSFKPHADELERRDQRYGLATLCVGGGMGVATVIERL